MAVEGKNTQMACQCQTHANGRFIGIGDTLNTMPDIIPRPGIFHECDYIYALYIRTSTHTLRSVSCMCTCRYVNCVRCMRDVPSDLESNLASMPSP